MKFWRKSREERELDEELRFHLEQEAQLRRERGQDPAGARRDFGNLALIGEATRETWGWGPLERVARDTRFAIRTLRKSPAFAVTAIAVLALGIGATTAIFSVVNAVLLRPLPFADPDRLVMVWERQSFGRPNVIQTQNFLDWRARNRSFSDISAIYAISMNLAGDGEPVQVPCMAVTAGFFEILRTAPLIGRTIAASRRRAGRASCYRAELWPLAAPLRRPARCPGKENRSRKDALRNHRRHAGGVRLSHHARRSLHADADQSGAGRARRTQLSVRGSPQAGCHALPGAARYGSHRGANGPRAPADEHQLERARRTADGADRRQIARHPDRPAGRGGVRAFDCLRQRVEPAPDARRRTAARDDGSRRARARAAGDCCTRRPSRAWCSRSPADSSDLPWPTGACRR